MKTVYIVYTRFTDDPSQIKGIFDNLNDAKKCYDEWKDEYKDMVKCDVNVVQNDDQLVILD